MKTAFVITILSLTLSLTACSDSKPSASTSTPTQTSQANQTTPQTPINTVKNTQTKIQPQVTPITINDELVINRKFTGEDDAQRYHNWKLNKPWRTNGLHNNLVFDLKTDGKTGYFAAQTFINNITSYPKLTSSPHFNPDSTALTNIKLNSITYAPAAALKLGSQFQGRFFIQIEIETNTGQKYRGQTNPINLGQNHPDFPDNKLPYEGELKVDPTLQWATYKPYANNPFTNGASIPLSNIKTIAYKWIVNVQKANTDGAGTVFLTFDNASATYTVSVQPKP
ncbi:hypothetical protein JD969_03500 [Planctomycetota bacterium]|nr:hypothetical protein JD969_03500 [Planctomycetota bacterium]